LPWTLNPGPQTDAYTSEADELYFGGRAGGGKTALLLILAATQHLLPAHLQATDRRGRPRTEEPRIL
jgi:hypothetical protein